MQVISGSLFCHFFLLLWSGVCKLLETSVLVRVLRAISRSWARWWHGSAVVRFIFEREGIFTRTWSGSLTCHLLSVLVNLPAELLHWIYRKFRFAFENSVLADLIYAICDNVPATIGWFMLLIMNIPYERWSNTYSLIGYVFFFVLAVGSGMRRKALRLDVVTGGPFIVLFFLAVFLSWPLSYLPNESFRFLFYHLSCVLCIYLVVSTVERAEQLERLASFLCLGMMAAAAVGILQRFQGLEVNASFVDLSLNPDMPGRIFSHYENPNSFAEMLTITVPVAVGLTFGAKKLLWKLVGLASALTGAVALVMTYSRASWVGLAAAALIFLFFWNCKLIPVCILVALACLPILPSAVFTRLLSIFNLNDTSTASRIPLYQAALRMIGESPVTGVGLGTHAVKYTIQDLGLYHGASPYIHAHNTYLEVWLETGLLGVVAFVAAMFGGLKQGAKAFRSAAPLSVRMILLGAMSGVTGALVCGLADYLWTYPRVMLIFWFTVALLLAGIKLAKQEDA